jgi:hypothetical protein
MNDDDYRLEKETYANAVKSVPEELKERDDWIVIDSSKEPFEPRKWSQEDDRMSFDAAVSVLLQKKEEDILPISLLKMTSTVG